ncbi:MAG: diadenylate cyclase CdaA [Clostridia bacterium]|nr:diadenylate cyclase CdaA [Clostridia bacterium]
MILGEFLGGIYSIWNQLIFAISNFRVQDIVDIAVMSFVIYKFIGFLMESRAGQLVKGIVILLVIYLIADWGNLVILEWALSGIMNAAIVAAAVIFQPEIRRLLEKVGHTNFKKGLLLEDEQTPVSYCIDNVAKAAGIMSESKIGALIVFERKSQLAEIISTGTVIDAQPSVSVINNIFFPKSPLHDGAMIIRDGRIYSAGCILPLTQREDISAQLGTRHRAAIGMTENSDAVVLVVSEETGIISIVVNGKITRNYSAVNAAAELKRILEEQQQTEKTNFVQTFVKKISDLKNIKGKEENK